ncbi:MAG: thiamine pyridinylase [Okeania sp. SIO3B5]|uniref:thiamine pyridinylase n=1 Tax=Okeania sp. SIO3B5 TaxID=2607811 RepID=UPI0014010D3D|nr:thiamine pyridinylase [Okeania sp. SIO3B5]NEO55809.1 thiamine pyridinylase [Okeania sp. SIO3B5]
MKKLINFCLMLLLFIVVSIFPTAEASANPAELKVGLYPYVPRIEQFETAIKTAWEKVEPDISLKFLSAKQWDGGYYIKEPLKTGADVYVFDAIFFDHFKDKGWLLAMSASEISDDSIDDFVDYAIEGVKDGNSYYAIPQLGCANILFYRKTDTKLANATNLKKINQALGQCTYTSDIPPDKRGLMLDMSGGTTNATLYLDTVHSINGKYPFPLPQDESQLNFDAVNNMRDLLGMASYENATDSQPPEKSSYQRAKWFSDGYGSALIGYTEAMSAMSQETRNNIDFKVMPLSEKDENYPAVFYADVIAVNPNTKHPNEAVKLAKIMASKETMVASIGKDDNYDYPQYLMANRDSVFEKLKDQDPLYNKMQNLIDENDPIMFKLNENSRDWLSSMKDTIKFEAREGYSCGCDRNAVEQISYNDDAPGICKKTCADYGGWNGQWTNDTPAAPKDTSVCGCNACCLLLN